ncbi:MAG TPA: hypothetical protein VGK87_14450, partial [Anaerolineae bacterium]
MRIHTGVSPLVYLALAALGVGGAALIIAATSTYGAAADADSAAYVSAARSLLAGNGFVMYDGTPFVNFAPLYSLVLAAFGFFKIDPLESARFVNALGFAGIIVVSGVWLHRHTDSAIVALPGALAALLAMPLILISVFVASETLFILLTLLFILALEQAIVSHRRSALVVCAVICTLAMLDRYIGITLLFTGLLLILLRRDQPLLRRLFDAVVFGAIASLPLLGWYARNYFVTGTLAGVRAAPISSLGDNIFYAMDTVNAWFAPGLNPAILRFVLVSLPLVAMLSVLVIRTVDTGKPQDAIPPSRLLPLLTFVLLYISFLIASSTLVAYDRIDSRLLSPIYMPLLLLIVYSGWLLVRRIGKPDLRRTLRWLLAVAFVLWLAWPVIASQTTAGETVATGGGGGYTSANWRNSSLIAYLKQHPPAGRILSNAPFTVYLLTGLSARMSP